MAAPKTKQTKKSVAGFIAAIPDPETRRDCRALVAMMKKATGAPPRMWGASIVGFGTCRYTYASGRTGDWPLAGFSPRKQNLTLYCMSGFDGMEAIRKDLGPHKTGKGCLYVKRLADLDRARLERLIRLSVQGMRRRHPAS
jgi:hypothetical protein